MNGFWGIWIDYGFEDFRLLRLACNDNNIMERLNMDQCFPNRYK